MPRVSVSDCELYYDEEGEGPPILFIMGLGVDLTLWDHQVRHFSRHRRTVVFDNRGVGGSDAPASPYSIPLFADDTVSLMDHLGIGRASIVGLSMGGMIAQELGIRHPDRIEALVLAATLAGPRHGPQGNLVLDVWEAMIREGISTEAFAKLSLVLSYTDTLLRDTRRYRAVLDRVLNPRVHQSPEAFLRQLDACRAHDARDRLSAIRSPTLILTGEQDVLTPPSAAEELAALIPGSELHILRGAGHLLNIEIAEEFNQAIDSFLEKHAV